MDDFEPFQEEPPEPRRKTNYNWPTRLNKLITYPAGWYCIAVFGNTGSADYWKRKLAPLHSDFEFRSHADYEDGTSKLYSRIRPPK